jgi:short-subunit dehydrogenase involved in D-alanine esterification of teichoic acids
MARLALCDRVVLVTGGARGIGLATAAAGPETDTTNAGSST